jgi:hypothetical protein
MEIYLFQLIQLIYDNHQLVPLQHAGSDLSLLFTPLSPNYASLRATVVNFTQSTQWSGRLASFFNKYYTCK